MRCALLLVLLASGCASQSREAREIAVDPFVAIPRGMTRGPSFFCYYAAPGQHRITPGSSDMAITTLDVTPGRRYVLRHAANVGQEEMLWVDPSAADRLFSEYDSLAMTAHW